MTALSDQAASRLGLWWHAIRPKTLTLSAAPVLAGSAWAAATGVFDPRVLPLALLAALAIQAGTNLWNDALDAEHGVDRGHRLGPVRITAAGLMPSVAVRRAALVAFAVAVIAGSALILVAGPVILAIGVAGIACGLLYSAGPRPLAATPFSELVVILFFGLAGVAGTVIAHGGVATAEVLSLGGLLGLPAAAVLLVNNHRDRAGDKVAGRRTLAILLGAERTRLLYGTLVIVAAIAPVVASGLGGTGFIAGTLLLVQAIVLARRLRTAPIDPGLDRLLAATARYQLLVVAAVVAVLLARA